MYEKKKIVYVDGIFDLTHYGHYNLFKQAKKLGDILYVGILSDEECKNYKRKTILNIEERYMNVICSHHIDKVIKNVKNIVTKDFIKEHNIDIVAHAHRMDEDNYYNYQYKDAKEMGKFVRLDYTSSISTTEIINRIKKY